VSAVIKTLTPFTSEELLLEALADVGAEPILISNHSVLSQVTHRGRISVGDILTNRQDYNGVQYFRNIGGSYQISHDAEEFRGSINGRAHNRNYRRIAEFLGDVEIAYSSARERLLGRLAEEERQKMEQERVARVEATRQQVLERAKAQGYSVREHREAGKIQLVLTRTVY
jgi:hypothetical protein